MVFYNDAEPFVCEWIKNLIVVKALPFGDVDERDIRDALGALQRIK